MTLNIIRTSDRGTFKKCRQLWDFTSLLRGDFEYVPGIKALDFGIAYHAALEVYYEPEFWDEPAEEKEAAAIGAFKMEVNNQIKRIKEANLWSEDMRADWKERWELGEGMLRHYFMAAPRLNKGYRPVKSEVTFEVPIPYPWYLPEKQLYLLESRGFTNEDGDLYYQGIPVVYKGRIDLILEDEDGRLWILDHKAQPLDEDVLTPEGWVAMGAIQKGDTVIGQNGKPTTVVDVFPQGELPCYKVTFSDGSSTRAADDHLWETPRGIVSTDKLVVGDTIPLVDPVEFDPIDLPVHPYILGLYLAEGSFEKSMITISSKDGETIRLAKQYLPEDHTFKKNSVFNNSWTLVAPRRANQWGEETNQIRRGLRELGLQGHQSFTKFIPPQYLHASFEQRLLLLQGLMDGDGMVSNGTPRFCSASKRLHEGVTELVRSLGGITRPVSWTPAPNGKPSGRLNFKLPNINPFQLGYKREAYKHSEKAFYRKVQSVEFVGTEPMQCISVEAADGLYVTKDYIVTHNTAAQFGQQEHLELDQQCGSYVWALWKILGLNIAGVIYSEHRKKVPKPPTVLKNGALSKAKNQGTSYDLYVQALDEGGYDTRAYEEFLHYLKTTDSVSYFRRETVHRSTDELAQLERNISLEAIDMLGDPSIYPNPSRWNCNGCVFRTPCLLVQEGGDWEWHLKHSGYYTHRGGRLAE